MSKAKTSKTSMTPKRASAIQSVVDRKPNPTSQQVGLKVRAMRAAERNKSK